VGGSDGAYELPSWLGETMPPRVCKALEDGFSEEALASRTGSQGVGYCHGTESWKVDELRLGDKKEDFQLLRLVSDQGAHSAYLESG